MKKIILSMFALAMTAMTFVSCEDVPAPYTTPTDNNSGQVAPAPTGSGTITDPYNAMGARKYVNSGGSADAYVYVKGVVVTADIDTNYGNATYFISDNGTTYYPIEVYRGYGLDSRKFTSTTQLAEGDTVVVCGKLTNYNGTYEFTAGSSLVEVNGKTITGTGSGTQGDPYDVEKALSLINTGFYSTTDEVYINGTISKVVSIDTKFGNATYYISKDGTTKTQLEVYRGYSLNGDHFTSADEIKVGDKVIIKGKLTLYSSTAEVAQGSSIISLNGSTGTLLNEPFNASQGSFTINNITIPSELSYVWKWASSNYGMKATAYISSTKTNYATRSRLTSPAFDLSKNTKATLTFDHAARYFSDATQELKLQVSTNGTTWTDVTIPTYPTGSDWSFVTATVDLSAYCGQKTVYVGFLYTSTSASAATWQIKNVLVK